MQKSFNLILAGYLLAIVDFSINGFDLLPDGLGYLLMAVGLGGLLTLSSEFTMARTFAFVLAGVWLIGFLVPNRFSDGYSLLLNVLNCILIWKMLGGIADSARKNLRPDLAQQAEATRIIYIGLRIWIYAAAYFFQTGQFARLLNVSSTLAIFAATIFIFVLIVRAKLAVAASFHGK